MLQARWRTVDGVGETQLADGISFTCDGWLTAWDDEDHTKFGQRLAVLDGTVYLKAPQAWTYGVAEDVATEVPMTNRAIRICGPTAGRARRDACTTRATRVSSTSCVPTRASRAPTSNFPPPSPVGVLP